MKRYRNTNIYGSVQCLCCGSNTINIYLCHTLFDGKPRVVCICRSTNTVYMTSLKWIVLALPVFMYYRGFQVLHKYMTVTETRHRAQIPTNNELTPVMAICGILLSTLAATCAIVLSRILVRRIYFNENTAKFRLIRSNVVGNRHTVVKQKSVIVTEGHPLFNHRLDNQRLYLVPESFSNASYHNMLVMGTG